MQFRWRMIGGARHWRSHHPRNHFIVSKENGVIIKKRYNIQLCICPFYIPFCPIVPVCAHKQKSSWHRILTLVKHLAGDVCCKKNMCFLLICIRAHWPTHQAQLVERELCLWDNLSPHAFTKLKKETAITAYCMVSPYGESTKIKYSMEQKEKIWIQMKSALRWWEYRRLTIQTSQKEGSHDRQYNNFISFLSR